MSKILKLINNERKNLIVKTKLAYDDLGCTYIDNVDCSEKDYERCEYAGKQAPQNCHKICKSKGTE